MGKVIVVVSGKGGTGKTTSVGAVASCLAAMGHKTLCLDGDIGLRNLDITLGMSDFAIIDFADVVSGHIELASAVVQHPEIDNLFFLTAPSVGMPSEINEAELRGLYDKVRDEYEYCFIDAPAGIGPGFRLVSQGADMAIVVVTGDLSSVRDGQRVVAELEAMGVEEIQLLVNRVRPSNFRRLKSTIDDIINSVGARILGIVKEDKAVILAANLEIPLVLYENKHAAAQFLKIARRLKGENVPISKR